MDGIVLIVGIQILYIIPPAIRNVGLWNTKSTKARLGNVDVI